MNVSTEQLKTIGCCSRFQSDKVRGKNDSFLCWVLQRGMMKEDWCILYKYMANLYYIFFTSVSMCGLFTIYLWRLLGQTKTSEQVNIKYQWTSLPYINIPIYLNIFCKKKKHNYMWIDFLSLIRFSNLDSITISLSAGHLQCHGKTTYLTGFIELNFVNCFQTFK